MVGRNKKASLNYIRERVWSILQEWKEKPFPQAGGELLLKVAVQANPTFAMSYFKLLVSLCQEIETLIRKFWVGVEMRATKNSLEKMGCSLSTKGVWGTRVQRSD